MAGGVVFRVGSGLMRWGYSAAGGLAFRCLAMCDEGGGCRRVAGKGNDTDSDLERVGMTWVWGLECGRSRRERYLPIAKCAMDGACGDARLSVSGGMKEGRSVVPRRALHSGLRQSGSGFWGTAMARLKPCPSE
jgi:hypothetical protein